MDGKVESLLVLAIFMVFHLISSTFTSHRIINEQAGRWNGLRKKARVSCTIAKIFRLEKIIFLFLCFLFFSYIFSQCVTGWLIHRVESYHRVYLCVCVRVIRCDCISANICSQLRERNNHKIFFWFFFLPFLGRLAHLFPWVSDCMENWKNYWNFNQWIWIFNVAHFVLFFVHISHIFIDVIFWWWCYRMD